MKIKTDQEYEVSQGATCGNPICAHLGNGKCLLFNKTLGTSESFGKHYVFKCDECLIASGLKDVEPTKPTLTFDESAKHVILDIFGANVNAEGFILTKEGNYFPSIDSRPVHINDFAGIINKDGKAVLVSRDITSLIMAKDEICPNARTACDIKNCLNCKEKE